MTDSARQEILLTATKLAEQDADKHYAALIEAFKKAIPEQFHRVGDFAPKSKRPLAFNADADGFEFFLLVGESYATTSALFEYKKKPKGWKLQGFMSRMGHGPYTYSQVSSSTLANAILASKELYEELQAKARSTDDSPEAEQADSRVTIN